MTDESYVLAGWLAACRWRRPAADEASPFPQIVVTASDCLTDFEPKDHDPIIEPWHLSRQDAVDAAEQAKQAVNVLAVSVPASGRRELADMIERYCGDYPHPIALNLADPVPPPAGTVHGFEILGFETGRFHSWLCYEVDADAAKLGIRPNDSGLVDSLADARRIARVANHKRGTHVGTPLEVTWFPALITEHGK